MSMNLGINLVEVDGATPSIQGAPTSVAGFVIRSQRGVPGVVRQISNFTQFTDFFGGYVAAGKVGDTQTSFVGAYTIRGFFDNGGTLAYVTRVVATDPSGSGGTAVTPAAPAAVTMSMASSGTLTGLTLTAGFRGQPDPGTWGNAIAVSVVPNLNVTNSFDLTVVSATTVGAITTYKVLETWTKLVVGGAAGARDPSVLNDPNTGSKFVRVATGAFAAWQPGTAYAAGATVTSGGLAFAATTGGTSAVAGPGGTGAAINDGSVVWATVPAWQASRAYAVGDAVTAGNNVYVATAAGTSGATGPTGTGAGIVDGGVTWSSATRAAWQPSHVYAAGAFVSNGGNTYRVTTPGTSAVASTGPTSSALSDGSVTWAVVAPAIAPAWQSSHTYAVNDYVTNGAMLYRATAAGTSGAAPGPKGLAPAADGTVTWVAVTGYTRLANGSDDNLSVATIPSLDSELAAVFSTPSPLDPLPIELLACPETSDQAVVEAALSYAANRGDCMFVGHVPDLGSSPLAAAKTYGQSLQGDKVYGALYMPYIQVVDPIGNFIWIPPTGHVLGVYARTDQQRGIWKAPAGNAAIVSNALDVRATFNDTDFTDLVKNGSVNAIRPIQGAGIIVDSSRTLSTNTLWLYVNVRLLFNFVKTSLRLGLRWVVQEPNDTTLWNKIKFNSVTPFLMGLWRRGAFGPGAPKDVFTVKVDAENNPPANIQQGILNIEVYFFPSRPAETIVITVGQQEGASTASET